MSPAVAQAARRDFLRQVTGNALFSQASPAASREPASPPSLAVHVAHRLMFGPRPGDIAAIESQGVDAWINQQLNPLSSDTPELTAALAALPTDTLSESTTTLYDRRYLEYNESIRPAREVRHATIARMLHSRWQLKELMVEFWHNHFNVYAFDSPIMCMFPEWDRIMRTHAFGNFRQLLEATGKHPVMLHYLDNYLSTNAGPNENYARELLELHTMGAINYNTQDGYIDEDVYEASRCFTGWSYERSRTAPDRGQFKYYRENHDRFQKNFLSTTIPRDQADLADGLKVYDLICDHPGTAYHIALKLCRRFISETPPDSIVDSTTTVFYQNRTSPNQIALTLKHIFESEEFRDPAHRMNKFKRPYDWIISAMRALDIPYIYRPEPDGFDMTYMMNAVGQVMFGWRSPDGPPDTYFYWATANAMLRRYNYILQIDAGWWTDDGLIFPALALMPSNLQTARQISQWWVDRILQYPVSSTTLDGLIAFAAEGRNYDLPLPAEQIADKASRVAALCVLSPEFMWR